MSSKFLQEANKNFEYLIKQISNDDYLNKLLFANIITITESYLYKVLTYLLENDFELLKKLTTSSKFKHQKIPLQLALTDIKKHILKMVKNLNYHNLADIGKIYKEVLDVNIEYNEEIITSIEIRHEIIHRNQGEIRDLTKTIQIFKDFLYEIDKQILNKYSKILNKKDI